MSDMDLVHGHIVDMWKQPQTTNIVSDACARVIASLYHNGQASPGYSFVSTGAIPEDPLAVWDDLFSNLWELPTQERIFAMYLYVYLIAIGQRAPVEGWANLWLD
ncbi:hypothetical protein L3Q65_38130 [Amycolatopsis sp. FU40]|uniref:hypothetical protein n=1 Tax=Amycolatopsis sp. FU40 TaxID=2914159 RepID=UPI001F4551EC|nr:hypothetical protein [Amycolatopsis sp. FU40]UKD53665.1 hypothetical protein L3Q65_38130 [Amycolatopsis sp. FU40]